MAAKFELVIVCRVGREEKEEKQVCHKNTLRSSSA